MGPGLVLADLCETALPVRTTCQELVHLRSWTNAKLYLHHPHIAAHLFLCCPDTSAALSTIMSAHLHRSMRWDQDLIKLPSILRSHMLQVVHASADHSDSNNVPTAACADFLCASLRGEVPDFMCSTFNSLHMSATV
ncbi:hypothetical protein ANCDUO_22179 [Ancylostoma duodenale]|uniref:Uncharacterized protein n=1 Tax=Ancylostoma duodenale TaxID=51022 RepID=A0A0C2FS47_9BILA|nr:hypothetical protein ANCDUO_22179 [Ancylostoma duodenale]